MVLMGVWQSNTLEIRLKHSNIILKILKFSKIVALDVGQAHDCGKAQGVQVAVKCVHVLAAIPEPPFSCTASVTRQSGNALPVRM